MVSKAEMLKAIKAHRLYKEYNSPTQEIPRDEITQQINPSGEATSRLLDLKRRLRVAVMRHTDFSPEIVRDNDELQQLIQSAIVVLYADGDGQIPPADFKALFSPLAGMVEGMLAQMQSDDPNKMADLRSFKHECVSKAFYKQLKKLIEQHTVTSADGYTLGKALSSMLTHLFIEGEKRGKVNRKLVDDINGMLKTLSESASPEIVRGLLLEVRGWRFIESEKLPDLDSEQLAKEKKMPVKGLQKGKGDSDVTGSGQPTGEDRWDGAKDGKGEKSKATPPALVQAPGNPKDDKEGKEEPQDVGGLDKGLPKKIDGQPLEPKKENVELRIVRDTSVVVEYEIRVKGKKVGEAKLNRMGRTGTIRGKVLEKHVIEAPSAFQLRIAASKVLNRVGGRVRYCVI